LLPTAWHKKYSLQLCIIASFLLISFQLSFAENQAKVAQSGAIPAHQSNRQSTSANPDVSKDIRQIQTLLALLKFNPGPIDGLLGKKTVNAIRAFQMDIGVPVTGKIDENLKLQLDGAYKLAVIRNQQRNRDEEETPQISRQEPKVAAELPAPKQEKKLASGKELEAKQPTKTGLEVQKEPTPNDPNRKTGSQYLKYLKISFPIVAVIFFAYLYRIWTRAHLKKSGDKAEQSAETEVETTGKVKPEGEDDELFEVQEIEEETTKPADTKAEFKRQEPVDYHDPSHPGYITPVVRRKVWIRNKGQCVACGSRKDLQYDYIIPLSERGDNTLDNLQLLCKTCSREKPGKSV
jgi:peptidoglycan hydrolase-like protein with peptidoglycan-binding domain